MSGGGCREFVHLHLTPSTACSTGRATSTSWSTRRARFGMKALAITDHGNMFGAVAFHDACREQGREADPRLRDLRGDRQPPRQERARASARPTTTSPSWPRTTTGYHNLVKLVSIGYTEGFYHRPRIDKEVLAEAQPRASSASRAASASEIGGAPAQRQRGRGAAQRSGSSRRSSARAASSSRSWSTASRSSAGSTGRCSRASTSGPGLPLVATNDAHYLLQGRRTTPTTCCSASAPARRCRTPSASASTRRSST